MRLHAGVATSDTASACRALVGGFGRPGQRDLDFGEKFIRYAETLEWPEGVAVEDLSYAAHLVLHRLQEVRPAKVVFVGAVSRGVDPPGTVRRYRLDPTPPPPEEVHVRLLEAVGGEVGFDHTLAVVRHWGGLPADAVVVEVEAADPSFGLGFSEEVGDAMDRLLQVVREEVGDPAPDQLDDLAAAPTLDTDTRPSTAPWPRRRAVGPAVDAASDGIAQLFEYVDAHAQVRALEDLSRRLPSAAGLSIAARFQPATRVLWTSGNWYDVIPLPDGAVGIAMGDVVGHGLEAASAAAQLGTAVRALAPLEGHRPGRIVEHLCGFVESLDVGRGTTFLYLRVDGRRGDVVLSNAGHCLPLVITPGGTAEFLEDGFSAPLGVLGGGPKPEARFQLLPRSTLLLFTAGLVDGRSTSPGDELQRLRRAGANGPADVEALAEHVLNVCLDDQPRKEDVSLVVIQAKA